VKVAKMAQAKQSDPYEIPKFLRVKRGVKKLASLVSVPTVAAETAVTIDPLATILNSGRYAPSALTDPMGRSLLQAIHDEKVQAQAARQEALAKAREARKAVWAGHVGIGVLAKEHGLRRLQAVAALAAACIIPVKGMIDPMDIAKARSTLAAYTPPVKRGASQRGPGGQEKAQFTWPAGAVVAPVKGATNPKREGTGAWKRWEKVLGAAKQGLLVASYLQEGGNPESLANAVKAGVVAIKESTGENTGGQDGAKVSREEGGDIRKRKKKAAKVAVGK